jgi:hypothetical protein
MLLAGHLLPTGAQLPGLFEALYSKTCLKRNLKGPEHFSAEARFPFNQGIL